MATLILSIRFAKLLSVTLLVAGTLGAFLPENLSDRRKFAYWIAGPAFGSTWIFGFLLAGLMGYSYLSSWILLSLATSLLSLNAVLYSVGREGRGRLRSSFIAMGALIGTMALMVWK